MSTTYSAIVELETNANQLLTRLSAASNAGESVKHARACLQEAIECLHLKTGSVLLLPAPPWATVQAFGDVQPAEVGDEAWLVA